MAINYVYDETYNVSGWFNPNQKTSGWFDDGFSETSGGGGSTGQIKVWSGSWLAKPLKVWNGSSWVVKPLKRWDGSSWVVTPY